MMDVSNVNVSTCRIVGTHVMEGSGRMLVTAVGPNSQAGLIFALLGATEGSQQKEAKREAKANGGAEGPSPREGDSGVNVSEVSEVNHRSSTSFITHSLSPSTLSIISPSSYKQEAQLGILGGGQRASRPHEFAKTNENSTENFKF